MKEKYKVVEIFTSIDGEGSRAGYAAVFVRFAGCNLRCSYCDTAYACDEKTAEYKEMTGEEIEQAIFASGIKRVTFTGGEPLLQKGLPQLAKHLADNNIHVSVETNGSQPIGELTGDVQVVLDYKTASSGMEEFMLKANYELLEHNDVVKFVVGSKADMDKAVEVITEHSIDCMIFFSPIFGKIEPKEIVEYIVENKLNNVRVQIQMHKVIWAPDKRGV